MGIVCTLAFTAWTVLSKYEVLPEVLCFPFDLYYTTIFGNLIMFVVGFGVGALLGHKRDLKNLTVWTQDKTPLD